VFDGPSFSTLARMRSWITALVIALVLVPPLVRATQTLDSPSPTAIRLNRGFDAPETKCRVVPPLAAVARLAPEPVPSPLAALRGHERVETPLAVGRHDSPPDALRGPPSSLI